MNKQFHVTNSVFHVQESNDANIMSDDIIKQARKSGKLNLSNRHLVKWPEEVLKLGVVHSDTKEIDMDAKKGDSFKWWELEPLKYLDMSSNSLNYIPEEIKELDSLMTLLLHQNMLEVIHPGLGFLSNLVKLDLAHNKISEFPPYLSKLKELRSLNLSNNLFKIFPETVYDLVMLNKLDISRNMIEEMKPGIGFLTRLDSLNLSRNKLSSIPPDLTNCRALKDLNLSSNEITSEGLPELINMNVGVIHLHYNQLTQLPKLRGCSQLKEIHLGFNKIEWNFLLQAIRVTSNERCLQYQIEVILLFIDSCGKKLFPSIVFLGEKLCSLNEILLQHAEVTVEELSTLSHLQTINLRNNNLKKLPQELCCLQNLMRLDLSCNDLTELPSSLSLLPHLEALIVEGNSLRTIRRDILQGGTSRLLAHLKQLITEDEIEKNATLCTSEKQFPDRFAMRCSRAVNLSSKGLCNIPSTVFEEAAAVPCNIVDLSKNKLLKVPEGVWLLSKTLNDLNLSQNQLKDIPKEISTCLNLRYLNVASNQLKSLPEEFGQCSRLRELNISFNRLEEIPSCVYNLGALEILNMSDNQIATINAEKFLTLKFLTHLDLRNNNLASVPPLMGKMIQLRLFGLDGNGLRALRPATLAKGTEAVLAWLRDKIV